MQTKIYVLDLMQKIGEGLFDEMSFDASVTSAETPPEEAFALRKGVCQDYSQIMIACLRSIGIPAGYVSGLI
ncbi:MAG: transglutaminase family protein, partial [Deltaproteobacteria bacterium]